MWTEIWKQIWGNGVPGGIRPYVRRHPDPCSLDSWYKRETRKTVYSNFYVISRKLNLASNSAFVSPIFPENLLILLLSISRSSPNNDTHFRQQLRSLDSPTVFCIFVLYNSIARSWYLVTTFVDLDFANEACQTHSSMSLFSNIVLDSYLESLHWVKSG